MMTMRSSEHDLGDVYPSDLVEDEWHQARPMIPPGKRGGKRTANGELFNPHGFTAARRSLPFGTACWLPTSKTPSGLIGFPDLKSTANSPIATKCRLLSRWMAPTRFAALDQWNVHAGLETLLRSGALRTGRRFPGFPRALSFPD